MNNIYVLSRHGFRAELKTMPEQIFMASAFISIHDPEQKIGVAKPRILEDSENVLNLWFHDSDEGTFMEGETLFDEKMAIKIKNFVESNLDKKQWFIHCTLGKCRSGAIGDVLSDYFQIPYMEFKRDNPQVQPNVFVKNILRKILINEIWD